MTFTITITDTHQLAGITAARLDHNAQNPGNQFADDASYVQYVMQSAAQSYASHYGT